MSLDFALILGHIAVEKKERLTENQSVFQG